MFPLSVLDLSYVVSGGSGPAALRNTLDLARLVDTLGYRRFWVAEHHNLPSVATTAPEVMIGQIAAATEGIRVGAGGVMPTDVALPPLWLLGSSGYSAILAASIGTGFAFAHHFATHDAADAMLSYRQSFRPCGRLAEAHAILGVAVVCAETETEAERL